METGAHCVTWETLKVKLVPDEAARARTAVTTIKSTQASNWLLAMLSYEERKPGAARVESRLKCGSLMLPTLPTSRWDHGNVTEHRALSLIFTGNRMAASRPALTLSGIVITIVIVYIRRL